MKVCLTVILALVCSLIVSPVSHGAGRSAVQVASIDNYESEEGVVAPSLTIFCAPKPYASLLNPDDPTVDVQFRALLSWLHLTPAPKIVLLGNDSTFHQLAQKHPSRISVEPALDVNFYGVPLFHSIVARAQAANSDMSMIINGDIILLNDIMIALEKVHGTFNHWVVTAARWDVDESFPYSFNPSMWTSAGGRSGAAIEKEVRRYVQTHGSLHTYGGVDLWVWNNSPAPLYQGAMPPFSFGRGKYDNWMTHEMVAAGVRDVVDVSEAVTAIHVKHSYTHVAESETTKGTAATKSFWSTRKRSSWELFANIHMAQAHGSYTNQKGTALHVPWKIASCHEPAGERGREGGRLEVEGRRASG